MLLMVRAEIKLYRGKRPTLEQMQRFEDKINKLTKDKFMADYKLKSREEEKELNRRMEEVQMLDAFTRKKK